MKNFLSELRRRKVIKVAIAYLVAAWVILQLADIIFPALNLPDWSITLALALLAIGLPLALVLAWVFDVTPDGIQRTSGDSEHEPPAGIAAIAAPESSKAEEPEADAPALDRSIAVLPFVDMSADRDHEHFCDGLTEELLNVLTSIPGLRVASRTSSFAFKGRNPGISAVAEKLRVSHILEGSVRKSGDRVRITTQLVEVASDSHLWSENYDRELSDIFAIQDDIAGHVLEAMKLKLGVAQLPESTTENAKAYEYYLRGRGYYLTKAAADQRRAADMFLKATQADPKFVRAWTDLAEVSATRALFLNEGEAAVELAEQASNRAMELAPTRADSHLARGYAHLAAQRYAEAEPHLRRAFELDPTMVKALHYLARAAHHQGKTDEERAYFAKATELDPEDWESALLSIGPNEAAGDMESARKMAAIGLERVERHLEDYPDNPRAYYLALSALQLLGDLDKAHRFAQKAMEVAPNDGPTRYNLACFYANIGEDDKALELLENSVFSRSWIENDPDFDNLRDHPRYRSIIESLTG